MPIKTRRYRKRNNKSCRTRKNKTTRRYKKQMKGGNGLITSEEELKNSWENKSVKSWVVNDGSSGMNIFREDAGGEIMPYGTKDDNVNMSTFRGKINYYLNKVMHGQGGAKIEVVYY
jgi:hypothetical protein